MKYYLTIDNDGLYRLCVMHPKQRINYWYPTTHRYFNVSNTLGQKIFPTISNEFCSQINVEFGIGDLYYLSVDANGIGHLSVEKPVFCTVPNHKLGLINHYWKFGKEFIVIPKEYMLELFNITYKDDPIEIKIKFNF